MGCYNLLFYFSKKSSISGFRWFCVYNFSYPQKGFANYIYLLNKDSYYLANMHVVNNQLLSIKFKENFNCKEHFSITYHNFLNDFKCKDIPCVKKCAEKYIKMNFLK